MGKKRRRRPAPTTQPEAAEPQASVDCTLTWRMGKLVAIIVAICVSAEIAFWLLDYHVNYGKLTDLGPIRRMCNAAREDGLASWFGTMQTFAVSLTAGGLYLLTRATNAPRWKRISWLVLFLFFFYMSADDGAEIHERMGSAFKAIHKDQVDASGELTAGASLLVRFPSYTWQIVYAPVFGGLAVFLFVFSFIELRTRRARILVIAALTCFVSAVGLDFIEGLDEDHPWNLYTRIAEATEIEDFTADRFGKTGFVALRHFSKTTEECIEMFGMTLLLAAFLGHIPRVARNGFEARWQDAEPGNGIKT